MIEEKKQKLINRPPIVAVLGHVDHGKSSILEAIKDLKITIKESGGITQHIGVYQVECSLAKPDETQKITFIDTPGHEAFDAMRSRGAKVADIALLVVAAEEGIKSQPVFFFLLIHNYILNHSSKIFLAIGAAILDPSPPPSTKTVTKS